MKTVRITESFDGYPNGKDEEHFEKGAEPTVSNAFADLIIAKGLAKDITAPAPAEPEPQPVEEPGTEDHHEIEPQAEPVAETEQKDTDA